MGLQAAFIALHTICFFLNIPPLIWHIISKNIPAITLLVYLELMMIDGFVGAVVWGGSSFVNQWNGKGWCDIMVRLQFAVSVGISSSISCVSFNLLMIFLTNKATTFWFSNPWVKPCVEIFCSIVFPLLISGISYFAQVTRFAIVQYSGCSAALTSLSISIVVFYLWIFVWSFIGTAISLATLFLYFRKKKAAKDILVCTNSGLSVKRFMRLLVYCILVICASIIFSAILGSNLNIKSEPFYDKNHIHSKSWDTILFLNHSSIVDTNKWVLISISFVSFFLFGIGQDAKRMYVSILNRVPGGSFILVQCGIVEDKFKSILGDSLMTDEGKYILRFWDSEDNVDDDYKYDKDSDGDDHSRDLERYGHVNERNFEMRALGDGHYSPSELQSEIYSMDGKFGHLGSAREEEHEIYSPTTPGTATTKATLGHFYNDVNLRHELQEAEMEVRRETMGSGKTEMGSSAQGDFDEMKYLYY